MGPPAEGQRNVPQGSAFVWAEDTAASPATQHVAAASVLDLLYASLRMPLAYCYSKSLRGVSSVARPEHGGENRTAVWASHHGALCSDGVVAPHGFAP